MAEDLDIKNVIKDDNSETIQKSNRDYLFVNRPKAIIPPHSRVDRFNFNRPVVEDQGLITSDSEIEQEAQIIQDKNAAKQ